MEGGNNTKWEKGLPGEIVENEKKGIIVSSANGDIRITDMEFEGKKVNIKKGTKFSTTTGVEYENTFPG